MNSCFSVSCYHPLLEPLTHSFSVISGRIASPRFQFMENSRASVTHPPTTTQSPTTPVKPDPIARDRQATVPTVTESIHSLQTSSTRPAEEVAKATSPYPVVVADQLTRRRFILKEFSCSYEVFGFVCVEDFGNACLVLPRTFEIPPEVDAVPITQSQIRQLGLESRGNCRPEKTFVRVVERKLNLA